MNPLSDLPINPHVTVDCVVLGYDLTSIMVVLVKRRTVEGLLAEPGMKLPGYYTAYGESLDKAAARNLKYLTGLEEVFLEQFHSFGGPSRELAAKSTHEAGTLDIPLDKIVTIAYLSLLKPNQLSLPLSQVEDARWCNIYEVGDLAYDHNQILESAIEALRARVKNEPSILFDLLPLKFTITQLWHLYEELFQQTIDKRNFYKRVNSLDYIVQLKEKQKDVGHKPANYFIFSKELYLANRRERFLMY